MWLNPPKRLIGGANQWSNIARSDFLCLQVSSRHRQHGVFRLITRRYPNYKCMYEFAIEKVIHRN